MKVMVIRLAMILASATALASADPAPAPRPASMTAPSSAVASPVPTQVPSPVTDPPPRLAPPHSLRDEATRVATDMVAGGQTNRDPDLLLMPWSIGRWSGNGRAAKLEAGAAGATLAGEVMAGFDGSPLAVLGLFAAGATLDAAAADVEAASPPKAPKRKPIKHRLR